MKVTPVAERSDPRIAAYTHLTDVDYRLAHEAAESLFMAEGELVIERVLRAGYAPRSALVSERKLHRLEAVLRDRDVEVFVADDEILATVTGYRVHRGALAAFIRPTPPTLEQVCASANFIVVLEDLVDHTNVGAIFRSAAALGADAAVISPRCADPLYRRALKVSMGATAMLPWARAAAWPDAVRDLREMGFTCIGLTPSGDTTLRALGQPTRPALLLGTEGTGLSHAALSLTSVNARIEMANELDSLNVAAAAAVACYALGSS